ncbi:M20/M25/M40 family metallo-hydrolase [Cryobacterium melibiosiphilum]|uniref:M20/M25/M40 family metallo-hydrolase n=1 Tax=Cryobacterium melibiosiphilum TaxID=995039 RepID=A0A3A5MKI3_9MICO|nr:M20/M25/M40 family metallo-hydrolase [Cryobacterium melibiosiphilum]RJT90617.1 M20/M25/M40 family metallo-hydrolase [Cryobacterium melibiosiphilum]
MPALTTTPSALAKTVAHEILADTAAALPRWVAFFRDLHAHPELAFRETRTAGLLAASLTAAGFTVTTRVGGTGVVGLLRNGTGPVVMLRGHMDGRPMLEQTDLAWRSRATQTVGGVATPVMHACGHDMQVTALAAAADVLEQASDRWRGTLMIVGQPAEDEGAGARAMLDDGLFTRFPRPDVVLGQHVGPFAVGRVEHPTAPWTSTVTDRVQSAHEALVPGGVRRRPCRMGCDDSAEFGIAGDRSPGPEIPSAFWLWGGMDPARFSDDEVGPDEGTGPHSARFELVDAPAIDVGRKLLVAAALEYLRT